MADQPLRDNDLLAKFFLLRWDQLDELAFYLNPPGSQSRDINAGTLSAALKQIRDRNLAVGRPYIEFMSDVKYSRRDFDKYQVWSVDPYEPQAVEVPFTESFNKRVWLKLKREQEPTELPMPDYIIASNGPGAISCMRKSS